MTNPIARRGVAGLLGAAFLWALALSVSPHWHQSIHDDARQVDHTCAVTVIASGSFDHAHIPLPVAPIPAIHFEVVRALRPVWVASAFLNGAVFEHAPPAFS